MIRMAKATLTNTAMICLFFFAIGVLNICYYKPFQAQMDMSPLWTAQNVDALLVKMMLSQWTNESGLCKKQNITQTYNAKISNLSISFSICFFIHKNSNIFDNKKSEVFILRPQLRLGVSSEPVMTVDCPNADPSPSDFVLFDQTYMNSWPQAWSLFFGSHLLFMFS